MSAFIKRWLALILLIIALVAFFYFDLEKYLTFSALKSHHEILLNWTKEHYVFSVIIFMLIYIAVTAASIPGATLLTLMAGFLFGIYWGTLYVVISATIGALCLFLAVRTALEPWLAKKASQWINKMRKGFQRGAFNYLLTLRLIPLFPFWVVNIVPALLGVRTSTFFITTLVGIIPGSFIYVLLGSGLSDLFANNQTPNLKIIFTPSILIPLIALGILSLLPILYRHLKGTRDESKNKM